METGDWTVMLTTNWPTIALIASLAFGIFVIVRFLAGTFEAFGDALGPVGKWFQARRAISQAESDDMRRQIVALDKRVRALLYRDECYFAYMMTDAEWHRRAELRAIAMGWDLEPHTPFLRFRDTWMRERGIGEELDIWT
ncbi:hypothetical protein SEA_DUNCANSLEG_30 [Mycobacterium phage DuncansLeg]|nr:hypothetical protein SEA_DUNCANSLEG_30 [Mycobacterium phage DuncansLeg]